MGLRAVTAGAHGGNKLATRLLVVERDFGRDYEISVVPDGVEATVQGAFSAVTKYTRLHLVVPADTLGDLGDLEEAVLAEYPRAAVTYIQDVHPELDGLKITVSVDNNSTPLTWEDEALIEWAFGNEGWLTALDWAIDAVTNN